MRRILFAALIATAPMAPAFADEHDWPREGDISIAQAIEIATSRGLVVIRSIEFDDGRWEVEGRNAAGEEVEFKIDDAAGQSTAPGGSF